jgi:hypothetical protein
MKRNYSLTQNFLGGLNELNQINSMVVEASQYKNRHNLYEIVDLHIGDICEAPIDQLEFNTLSNSGDVFIICKN